MTKRLLFGILIILLVTTSLLAACTKTTTTAPASTTQTISAATSTATKTTSQPVAANWWDELGVPKYGGSINFYTAQLGGNFDVAFPGSALYHYYDHMWVWDWTIDRDTWNFRTLWAPNDYFVGGLVESWEWTDAQTMVAHLRQNVYWQNKAPVNGRQFVADDVVYHYDRLLGTGSGFTEPNFIMGPWAAPYDRITATDKYTVMYKFKEPTPVLNAATAFDIASMNMIEPREVVEADINKWENAAGTGAFMLTDFVEGNSATYTKNPNYQGYDPRYPENRVPYVDEVKMICIPDSATALASMRTGRIDYLSGITWQQSETLAKSNPEIIQISYESGGGAIAMRVDKDPFTDINVRKALNMSIDRQAIAESFYGGTVSGKPAGMISPVLQGWCVPFDEWPQELKEEYSYHPDRSRELLAGAGYPNGFNTNIVLGSGTDTAFIEMIKAYFHDIGVEMDINMMDPMALRSFIQSKKHDQMANGMIGATHPPNISVTSMITTQGDNPVNHGDTAYDALADSFTKAQTTEEAQKIALIADMYPIERHWQVIVCTTNAYVTWQPWLKGYTGENLLWSQAWIWPCLWIDKD